MNGDWNYQKFEVLHFYRSWNFEIYERNITSLLADSSRLLQDLAESGRSGRIWQNLAESGRGFSVFLINFRLCLPCQFFSSSWDWTAVSVLFFHPKQDFLKYRVKYLPQSNVYTKVCQIRDKILTDNSKMNSSSKVEDTYFWQLILFKFIP